VQKFKDFISAAFGDFLWLVILTPVLTISWLGFYTVARDIGIPPIFAAGLSAAFDGIAIFAARIGLKHRRKGFSGWLARLTVIAFAALGAFVQSFHGQTEAWIHAHSWIIWSTAPIAAILAYELHLGWIHRKQLIRRGYDHPSAKSGFGPATWLLIGGTYREYRAVLRARRDYIVATNQRRFLIEDAAQPKLEQLVQPLAIEPVQEPDHRATVESVQLVPAGVPVAPVPSFELAPVEITVPNPVERAEITEAWYDDDPGNPEPVPSPIPIIRPKPAVQPVVRPVQEPLKRAARHHEPKRPASKPARPAARAASSKSASARRATSRDATIRDWCVDHGYKLGYGNRIPIDGLRAYRKAHATQARAS
jgi:hypothetical protein